MNFVTVLSVTVAVLAAIIPLYAMVIIFRQRTGADWQAAQSERIKDLFLQLETCQSERRRLEDENVKLLRRLFQESPSS